MLKSLRERVKSSAIDYYGVVDPLAEDMKAIDQQLGGHLLDQQSESEADVTFLVQISGDKTFYKRPLKELKPRLLLGLLLRYWQS